jgi:hypothetical protein
LSRGEGGRISCNHVILWEKKISGSCRNYPSQVGILKLESEKREKIERARRAARLFLCGLAAREHSEKHLTAKVAKGRAKDAKKGQLQWLVLSHLLQIARLKENLKTQRTRRIRRGR